MAAPVAAQHRPGRHVDRRQAHRDRAHDQAGRGLVAAAHQHRAVDRMAAQQLLAFHGEEVAVEHGRRFDERLGQRHRRQLDGKAAGLPDAAFHVFGARAQMPVAGVDVAPGVEDADHRLAGPVGAVVAELLSPSDGRTRAGRRGRASGSCGVFGRFCGMSCGNLASLITELQRSMHRVRRFFPFRRQCEAEFSDQPVGLPNRTPQFGGAGVLMSKPAFIVLATLLRPSFVLFLHPRKSRGERSAERRKFIWSAPHQQMSPLARAFGRGSAPNSGRARLPALHCGSRQGLSPVGSAPGQASWDAVSAGVTRLLLSQSRESTSRTGRSTGEHDAQNRPGADCKSARGDRPCSAIGYASRVRPSNEQGDCVGNIIGDECQGHRLRLRDAVAGTKVSPVTCTQLVCGVRSPAKFVIDASADQIFVE